MTILDEQTFRAMGTDCRVLAGAPDDASDETSAIGVALDEIARCERVLSRFDPASDLSRVNAGAGSWIEVDPILIEALAGALRAREETDGLYDPTILPALVLAGYDRSFEQLAALEHPAPRRPHQWRAGAQVEIDADGRRVRVPVGTGIDLGGIGKGYSATRAVDAMLRSCARHTVRPRRPRRRCRPRRRATWQRPVADRHRRSAET